MSTWQGLRTISNIWIELWTSNSDISKNNFYLTWFTVFSLSYGFFAGMRALVLLVFSFITCRIIHNNIIKTLFYASINDFFDRIPIGRILNRLSKDLTVLVLYSYKYS